jgi:anti-sigma regulatory factor (Ser/Thr protein kinase)
MPYYRCAACGLTSYSAAAHSSASACPTCPADLRDASQLYVVPGAKHDIRCSLRGRPEATAEARRALVGLALPEATRDQLALLVTELVSNSVLHAGITRQDPIDVELTNGTDNVRLAVHDGGHGFAPPAPDAADPLEPGGRGLVIVAALSESWGVDCDPDGCTVWCQVPVDEPAAGGRERVTSGHVREIWRSPTRRRQPAESAPSGHR